MSAEKAKTEKSCFLIYFSKNLIQITPTTKDVTTPTITSVVNSKSLTFKIVAPAIIGTDNKNVNFITSSYAGTNNSGKYPKEYHFIETMGDLEDAVEYKPNRLEGQVNMDIDFKDIDTNRIFTNEEIGQMSSDEFARLENFINQQLAAGKVMPEAQAKQQMQAGNLIYVNSYTRSDGTQVKGYYRSRPRF